MLDEEIVKGIASMHLFLIDNIKLIGEIKAKRNCSTEWPCHFLVLNNNYNLQRKSQSKRGDISKNGRYSKRKNSSKTWKGPKNKMRTVRMKKKEKLLKIQK